MSKTIISFLEESVKKFRNKPFLYEARTGVDYSHLTYEEVQQKSEQLAAGLIDLGVNLEDRIALISEGKIIGL